MGPRRTQNVILSFRPMYNIVKVIHYFFSSFSKEESSESDEEEKVMGPSDILNNYSTVQGHVHLSGIAEDESELHGEHEVSIFLTIFFEIVSSRFALLQ